MNNKLIIRVLENLIKFLKLHPLEDSIANFFLWQLFDFLSDAADRGFLSLTAVSQWFPHWMSYFSRHRYRLYPNGLSSVYDKGGER